jgi:hypothetical protein
MGVLCLLNILADLGSVGCLWSCDSVLFCYALFQMDCDVGCVSVMYGSECYRHALGVLGIIDDVGLLFG